MAAGHKQEIRQVKEGRGHRRSATTCIGFNRCSNTDEATETDFGAKHCHAGRLAPKGVPQIGLLPPPPYGKCDGQKLGREECLGEQHRSSAMTVDVLAAEAYSAEFWACRVGVRLAEVDDLVRQEAVSCGVDTSPARRQALRSFYDKDDLRTPQSSSAPWSCGTAQRPPAWTTTAASWLCGFGTSQRLPRVESSLPSSCAPRTKTKKKLAASTDTPGKEDMDDKVK